MAKTVLRPVRRQHVVSRAILSQWCSRRLLDRLDLEKGRWKEVGTKGFGVMEWFVRPEDSVAFEEQWQPVEKRIPEAIRALHSGTALHSQEMRDLLSSIVALHLVRGHQFRWIHDSNDVALTARRFADPEEYKLFASGLYRQKYGIEPVGPEGFADAHALADAHFESRLGVGSAFFAERVRENYLTLRTELSPRPVEVGIAKEGSFLIGDSPALTVDARRRLVGFTAGVGLQSADLIVMPMTPKHLVSFGPGGVVDIGSADVAKFNDIQIAAAKSHVAAVPDDGHQDDTDRYLEVWRHREAATL